MITIDLVGPPGSGKTTLARGLRRGNPDVLSIEQLFVRAALSRDFSLRDFLSPTNRMLLLTGATRLIPIVDKCRLIQAQGSSWEDLFHYSLRTAATVRPSFRSIAGLTWLCESAFNRALANNLHQTKSQAVIFSEPLSFRPSILNLSSGVLGEGKPYFELVPPPDAVIILGASAGEIKRRIDAREARNGRVLDRHLHMSEAEKFSDIEKLCALSRMSGDVFRARGVECLELDTKGPLDETLDLARRFVRDLVTKSNACESGGEGTHS